VPVFLYLLYSHGVGALVNVPRDLSADNWGRMQDFFCQCARVPRPHKGGYVECYHLYENQRMGDVYWVEELASSQGMRFTLLPLATATNKEVMQVKSNLRHNRDVVGLSILRVKRWIQFPPVRGDAQPTQAA
jgi:hypothetical protein